MNTVRDQPPVYIAPSAIHGDGLFASRNIAQGEMIGVYEGPQVTEDGIYVLWIEDEPGGNWTGFEGRNIMRFLNHSADPNAEMDGLNCYALAKIPADAEITIDYGWNDS